MKTSKIDAPNKLPKTFSALNTLHPLRPIRDEIDYDNMVEIVDRLAVLDRRNTDQEDYLETLATLIAHYGKEHYAADLSNAPHLLQDSPYPANSPTSRLLFDDLKLAQ